MKNKKRRVELITFFDHTGIESHLEKMAAKGWLLEKMSAFTWLYRRIEPKKIHFAVTYYPPASAFDPTPSEKQKTYWDFCEYDGWHLAAAGAQMQVFYNEQINPAPIETDALLQVEMIHKVAKKNFLISNFVLLCLGVLQAAILLTNFLKRPVEFLVDNGALVASMAWIMTIVLSALDISSYYHWHYKAQKAAECDGSFVPTHNHQKLQKILLFLLILSVGLWIISAALQESWKLPVIAMSFAHVGILLGAVLGIKNFLKKKNASARANRIATFITCILMTIIMAVGMNRVVFSAVYRGWFEKKPVETYEYGGYTMNVYHDELPLKIEDMRYTEYEGYSYKETKEQSIFLTQTRFSQYPHYDETEVPDLEYTVTRMHFLWMYDFCLKGIQKELKEYNPMYGYDVEETDASVWNAEKVYLYSSDYGGKDKFLICYPEKIVELTFGWDATPEEMNIAAEVFAEEK